MAKHTVTVTVNGSRYQRDIEARLLFSQSRDVLQHVTERLLVIKA
jgi:hypothetical protein